MYASHHTNKRKALRGAPSQMTNAQRRGCGKSGVDRIALINNLKANQIETTVEIGSGFIVDVNAFVHSFSAIPEFDNPDDSC